MNSTKIGQLVDLWIRDESFRRDLRVDPVAAVTDRGIDLDEEEVAAVRAVDWTLSDAELESRISHAL